MSRVFIFFIYSVATLMLSCKPSGRNNEVKEEISQIEINKIALDIDSTSNKLKKVPSSGTANLEVGFFEKDSFLYKNITRLNDIEVYKLKQYKGKTSGHDQFRLIAYNEISNNFDTYILFDDYYGEAGSYILYTIDSLGFTISSIEFKGGDGWENGGYSVDSEFLNDTVVSQIYKSWTREQDSLGNYLPTWTNQLRTKKFVIDESGAIYLKSTHEDQFERQKERI